MSGKNSTGSGMGAGSVPFTRVGGMLQGAVQAQEHLGLDAIRKYRGWLSDVRLPLEDSDKGFSGPMVKILFDSQTINKVWGETWFRLQHDPVELLSQFGTEDTIKRSAVRLELQIFGVSFRQGVVRIIGDRRQEYTHRNYTKTPVRCWADIIPGIAKGGP